MKALKAVMRKRLFAASMSETSMGRRSSPMTGLSCTTPK